MTDRRTDLRAEWERIMVVNAVLEAAIDRIPADDADAVGKAVDWANAAIGWIDRWRDAAADLGGPRIDTVDEWRSTYGAHGRAMLRLNRRIQRHAVQQGLVRLIADAVAGCRRALEVA